MRLAGGIPGGSRRRELRMKRDVRMRGFAERVDVEVVEAFLEQRFGFGTAILLGHLLQQLGGLFVIVAVEQSLGSPLHRGARFAHFLRAALRFG